MADVFYRLLYKHPKHWIVNTIITGALSSVGLLIQILAITRHVNYLATCL